MLDKFGTMLSPGMYVAYAIRQGNSAQLRIGKVVSVTDDSATVLWSTDYYYRKPGIRGKPTTIRGSRELLVLDYVHHDWTEVLEERYDTIHRD